MIIFPAIDLRQGQCVRLLYGDPNAQTTYSDDPAAVAVQFAAAGAEWLHVVNLDGAFGDSDGADKNRTAVRTILKSVNIPIQVGGGIRTTTDIEQLLALGVRRVILGTAAVERSDFVATCLAHFGPDRIVVGIDAKDGQVATHGWQTLSQVDAITFGRQMHALGVTTSIYTDIHRDGALTGANIAAGQRLAAATGLQVIISGGVAGLDDVRRAKTVADADEHITGLIIGRALYTGDVILKEALKVANMEHKM